jgi:hypothetical protein
MNRDLDFTLCGVCVFFDFQTTWSCLGVKDFPFFYLWYFGVVRLKDLCKVVCQDVCFLCITLRPVSHCSA